MARSRARDTWILVAAAAGAAAVIVTLLVLLGLALTQRQRQRRRRRTQQQREAGTENVAFQVRYVAYICFRSIGNWPKSMQTYNCFTNLPETSLMFKSINICFKYEKLCTHMKHRVPIWNIAYENLSKSTM